MSGKGQYFLVRNIQSLLGAKVLFSAQEVFRESAPTLVRFAGPGKAVLGSHREGPLRRSGCDACPSVRYRLSEWWLVIFSYSHPVEAFQRLFNI